MKTRRCSLTGREEYFLNTCTDVLLSCQEMDVSLGDEEVNPFVELSIRTIC